MVKVCKICNSQFETESNIQKICKICSIKKCLFCGKQFKIYYYNKDREFCSSSCYLKFGYKNKKILYGFKQGENNPCYSHKNKSFDDIFGVEKSKIIREKISDKQQGNKNSNWVDGKNYYRKFLKEQCELCKEKNAKIVHHKDKNRSNNVSSNLLSVCHQCHHKIHYHEIHEWRKRNEQ